MALTPEDVLNKTFTQTQFRRGYDEREVDDVRHDDDSTLVFGDHPQSRGAHSADERGQY